MKGRVFSAKRGNYIEREKIEDSLEDVFGEYQKDGDIYTIKNYKAFEEMKVELIENKNKKNKMRVNTTASMEKADMALETKKDLNEFLEEVTGYTAKERRKRMKNEVEG
ncbi:hypothetical protein C9439_03235 [archaeon SCG-AAA382B04]|nr:hypothetical protein C9439_03235 [archaeon SCG-AAA382B04]